MSSAWNDLHGAYRARLLVAVASGVLGCGATGVTPRVDEVRPALVCGGGAKGLAVIGAGFAPAVRQGLGQAAIELPRVTAALAMTPDGTPASAAPGELPVRWLDADTLDVTLTADSAASGVYDLTVANPGGGTATRAAAFTRDAAPPTVDSVAPMLLCASGGALTARGGGFVDGATVALSDPATNRTLAASSVAITSPTELTATFGALPFQANVQLTFTVTAPDGCSGALAGAVMRKAGGGGCP